jgi:hypothetical protein
MATGLGEPQPRGSVEFAERSVLEAIIPASSDIDIEDELNTWEGTAEDGSGSILPTISQRNLLLLGKCRRPRFLDKSSYSCTG